MGITDFVAFLVGTIFIVLLPGPNSLFVLTTAGQRGVRSGYAAACGVFVGDAILMLAAASGAAFLLQKYAWLDVAVRTTGALYLSWIGIELIVKALRDFFNHKNANLQNTSQVITKPQDLLPQSHLQLFSKALLISLLNPKAILFFVSFFIQFVDPTYPHPVVSFLLLSVVVQLCSFLYLTLLIYGGVSLADFFKRAVVCALLGKTLVGLLFIGFAARLLIQHL